MIRVVHLHDAFVAGSLTAAQTAELAGGAAGWLEPQWPKSLDDADEVKRLAAITRELLELRDHALAVAASDTNIGRVVVVDPGLREILRSQTLLVLEFSHEQFEDVCDVEPAELLATASIFRDAITVLDTIGWLPSTQTTTIDVTITAGHLAQLERLRADLAMSILASLDSRDDLTAPEDIARLDQALAADRLIAQGLLRIVRAGTLEA